MASFSLCLFLSLKSFLIAFSFEEIIFSILCFGVYKYSHSFVWNFLNSHHPLFLSSPLRFLLSHIWYLHVFSVFDYSFYGVVGLRPLMHEASLHSVGFAACTLPSPDLWTAAVLRDGPRYHGTMRLPLISQGSFRPIYLSVICCFLPYKAFSQSLHIYILTFSYIPSPTIVNSNYTLSF